MKQLLTCLVLMMVVFGLASCSFKQGERENSRNIGPSILQPTESRSGTTAASIVSPTSDAGFVCVADFIPDIVVDLKYATVDNFTGQVIYNFQDVYLRYGTVKKLMLVQEVLRKEGLALKIWDGFRPPSAQFTLWGICPDPRYVSDPNNGFSSHSRGNTVDITLVDDQGKELIMPTGFDDFSELADRNYNDCSEEAAQNARYLEELMVYYGFKGYYGEWWHYTDTESYEVEMDFLSE